VYDSELQRWFGSRLADIYGDQSEQARTRRGTVARDRDAAGSEAVALARQETLLRSLGRMQDLADVLAREGRGGDRCKHAGGILGGLG